MKKLIYFDPGDRKALNTIQLLVFWDSMREWFAEKGYHLYEFDITDEPGYLPSKRSTIPYNPHPKLNVQKRIFEAEDPFPYAYVGGDYRQLEDSLYEVHHISNGRVVFAQDVAGRHVVIKLVKGGACGPRFQIKHQSLQSTAKPTYGKIFRKNLWRNAQIIAKIDPRCLFVFFSG